MTLSDFKDLIPTDILDRGYYYFRGNRIISIEEEEPEYWEAEVSGSEIYSVAVRLNKNEIVEYYCDCPYEGNICKHVTAVLFKLAKNEPAKNKEKKTGNIKKSKKQQIDSIFEKVSKEDLKSFIEHIFGNNSKIKNSFIAFFAEYIDESLDFKYKNLVKNIIRSNEDRHSFIDYRASFSLSKELSDLLLKAEAILDDNLTESLAICKALIEEIPLLVNHTDDSSGYLTDLSNISFDIFSRIAEISPPQLKDELFNYCVKEVKKEKYYDFGFGDGFFLILPILITLEEQEIKYLKLFDDLIKNDNNISGFEYRNKWLLKEKVNFLNIKGHHEEARKIIEENIEINDFREILFDKEFLYENYDKAIEICLEGIKIAQKKSHYGYITLWKEKVLSVYEILNDTDNIRKYSKELFDKNQYDMKYYRRLKETYKPKEWEKISESIIDEINVKDAVGDYGQAQTLANIFVEEKHKSRLLKLLEINSAHINFVDEFAIKLKDDYPEEISEYYLKGIKEIAKNASRQTYNEVAHYIKKLRKIDGGEKRVKSLVKYFKDTYKNRPAMMEILKKNFKDFF